MCCYWQYSSLLCFMSGVASVLHKVSVCVAPLVQSSVSYLMSGGTVFEYYLCSQLILLQKYIFFAIIKIFAQKAKY